MPTPRAPTSEEVGHPRNSWKSRSGPKARGAPAVPEEARIPLGKSADDDCFLCRALYIHSLPLRPPPRPAVKTRRHATIRTLIAAGEIRSQQELGQRLAREGIEVTQATLSRDLAEIGVLKGPDGYQLPGAATVPANEETLARVLRRELLSATAGGTLVVLKTLPGHGNALAIELDRASTAGAIKGVLGSIAGDDTIFLAASSELAARRLAKELRGAAQLV